MLKQLRPPNAGLNKRKRRIGLITVGLVLVLLLSYITYLSLAVYYGPVPKTDGTEHVAGLNEDVTVYRDSWGIPHIYASNVDDLFFAQGYTHAQDRWWQMELSRKMARGDLTSIAKTSLDFQQADRLIQTLGWLESSETEWENASPQTQQVLIAYSAGVNAYIAERNTDDLAMEYGLVALVEGVEKLVPFLADADEVEGWTPVDTLLWGKMLAWQMSGNWWQELETARAYSQVDNTLMNTYLAQDANTFVSVDDPVGISSATGTHPTQNIVPNGLDFTEQIDVLNAPLIGNISPELLTMIGLPSELRGNSWAISGQHTTTGKPLLANDLQGDNSIPSTWFEMGLHCRYPSVECPYDVVGFSIAGVPGIVVGHNDKISWGINSVNADNQDLYLLSLNPENRTQYWWDGTWVDLHALDFALELDDEETLEHTIYQTHLGPVLTDIDLLDNSVFDQPYQAIALRWIDMPASPTWLDALLQMNQAQSWSDFTTALSGWNYPALHFIYADTDGNIGYQLTGTYPVRSAEHTGLVPVPASPDFEWRNFVPYEYLPTSYNPASGIVINANNAVISPEYMSWLGQQISPTEPVKIVFSHDVSNFRAERIAYLLNNRTEHTLDSFGRMQADNHNVFAEAVLPYVTTLETDDPELVIALEWLAQWDLQNDEDSPQAVWFETFWIELATQTFGEKYPLALDENLMQLTVNILDDPENAWWDDNATPFTIEIRDDILLSAVKRSFTFLQNTYGDDPEQWQWGDVHRVYFVSRLIGQTGVLPYSDLTGFPINRGKYSVSGGITSLNTTYFQLHLKKTNLDPDSDDEENEVVLRLPAYRMIIDLSDFGNSRSMHIAGQSGHPASENYDDMITPWRTVDYHNMGWGRAIIDEAERELELWPILEPTADATYESFVNFQEP